ncbi:hypothetical protein GCM10008957_31970 [Deinococcus ruber]|uniref:Uncharacterized protein n=2 Tax=Deinococcus ruber TaxID=1848197 RepID=A0A918CCK4_9DEIO|nr:hypothetical protein GCM10008957_31970 [Deinococcus ruber]
MLEFEPAASGVYVPNSGTTTGSSSSQALVPRFGGASYATQGTEALTLGASAVQAAGLLTIPGTAAWLLGMLSAGASGVNRPFIGPSMLSVAALTALAAGELSSPGLAALLLVGVQLAASGMATPPLFEGTLSLLLGALLPQTSGTVQPTGRASVSLTALAAALSAGNVPFLGKAGVALAPLSPQTTAEVRYLAQLQTTFQALLLSGVGAHQPPLFPGPLVGLLGALLPDTNGQNIAFRGGAADTLAGLVSVLSGFHEPPHFDAPSTLALQALSALLLGERVNPYDPGLPTLTLLAQLSHALELSADLRDELDLIARLDAPLVLQGDL